MTTLPQSTINSIVERLNLTPNQSAFLSERLALGRCYIVTRIRSLGTKGSPRTIQCSAECQQFAAEAPIIYIPDPKNLNSYCLRLQSIQGPDSSDSPTVLARRVLTILRDAGIAASARMPRAETMLRPIKQG